MSAWLVSLAIVKRETSKKNKVYTKRIWKILHNNLYNWSLIHGTNNLHSNNNK